MRKVLALLIIFTIFSNCSTDNNNDYNESIPNIHALAVENQTIYQLSIFQNGNEVEVTNLSATLGLPLNYYSMDVIDNVVTFFDRIGGRMHVYQKDLSTNDVFIAESICFDENENAVSAFNSEDKIIVITIKYLGNGEAESFARVFDKNSGVCELIPISNEPFGYPVHGMIMHDNAYIHLFNDSGAILYNIDLNNNSIVNELEIENPYSATAVNNKVYFFHGNEVLNLDPNTLETISTTTLSQNIYFGSYWFKTQLLNNEMLINFVYPQPSSIAVGPATINITNGEFIEGANYFLFDVINNFNESFSESIYISCFETDLESRTVYCGFGSYSGSEKGGIIKTNFEGEILGYVQFDYVPYKLIL